MIGIPARRFLVVSVVIAALIGTARAENLLKNPGFEESLAPAWEKRTPDSADRKLSRQESAGRSGSDAAVLENLRSTHTRLRQGQDRSIAIEPGSFVELSAWTKSELSDEGQVTLQLYCMDAKNQILSQPTSAAALGRFDWTQQRLRTVVPKGTAYLMAYLQTRDGVGRVFFDDVELSVKRKPMPEPPAPKVGLMTDLPDDSPCLHELKVLFEDGLVRLRPEDSFDQCQAALILFQGSVPPSGLQAMEQFAQRGGRVFMDVRNFAQWQKTEATAVVVGAVQKQPVEKQMLAGLRVVKTSEATAGFAAGQIMPRAGWPDGKLFVLPAGVALPGMEVLAVGPREEPGLVRLTLGQGSVTAADVLSLREPYHKNVDAYYKYTVVTGALTNPVRFGQYYAKKLPYAEFVELLKQTAADYPAIRFQEEGPASEGYRLCSLNLGRPGAPLYFLYAAAHGSEWEPGYGLVTFARRVAEGAMKDVIDLDKVQIKIVPYLNPWGYDHMRRQNAQGVDLNRQGDYCWDKFKGTDSNKDGKWSAGDYDWKGNAPLSEPEARTYQAIVASPNLYCILDFHGNGGARDNKIGILPVNARSDNEFRAMDLQQIANRRLRGRHLLHQADEDSVSQYLLARVYNDNPRPVLMHTAARDRYGLLIELAAGYGSSYGTVLQTDVTCELCRALFLAYPTPAKWPE
jgi:hypothetical protein